VQRKADANSIVGATKAVNEEKRNWGALGLKFVLREMKPKCNGGKGEVFNN